METLAYLNFKRTYLAKLGQLGEVTLGLDRTIPYRAYSTVNPINSFTKKL